MRKTIFSATLAAALAAAIGASAAPEEIAPGVTLGANPDAIRASLVEKGYEVRKIQTEDDELEAYALKDGHRYEIYVDTTSGAVTKVKADD